MSTENSTEQNTRFTKCFASLAAKKEGALVPFLTLGDPSFELSLEILKTITKAGADGLAVAIPFSDPVTDGIAIQKAHHRALGQGMTMRQCFELLKQFREFNQEIPICIHVYSNLVIAYDVDRFYQNAKNIGIDAVLLPDVAWNLADEDFHYRTEARNANVAEVLITPPNAPKEVITSIGKIPHGYTYVLAKERVLDPAKVPAGSMINDPVGIIKLLRENGNTPPLLGLGINTPQDVMQAMRAGASGVIIGSAIVKYIADNLGNPEVMLKNIFGYIRNMKAATQVTIQASAQAPAQATAQAQVQAQAQAVAAKATGAHGQGLS